MPDLTVVGSVNLDFVVAVGRLPERGETVTDGVFSTHPGGKGANQALAARRAGAEVDLVAAVGDDPNSEQALGLLRRDGVGLDHCWAYEGEATGVALIMVGESGENLIAVAPGANRLLTPEVVELRPGRPILCQLEIPVETVSWLASRPNGFLAINAAPARRLPDEVFRRADLVVVNEVERDFYQNQLELTAGISVVTMGAAGAVAFRQGRPIAQATPPAVEVIDTVGAGDAFMGVLTVSLLEGAEIRSALERACAAGALATTKPGAQPSLPTAAEINAIMAQ